MAQASRAIPALGSGTHGSPEQTATAAQRPSSAQAHRGHNPRHPRARPRRRQAHAADQPPRRKGPQAGGRDRQGHPWAASQHPRAQRGRRPPARRQSFTTTRSLPARVGRRYNRLTRRGRHAAVIRAVPGIGEPADRVRTARNRRKAAVTSVGRAGGRGPGTAEHAAPTERRHVEPAKARAEPARPGSARLSLGRQAQAGPCATDRPGAAQAGQRGRHQGTLLDDQRPAYQGPARSPLAAAPSCWPASWVVAGCKLVKQLQSNVGTADLCRPAAGDGQPVSMPDGDDRP